MNTLPATFRLASLVTLAAVLASCKPTPAPSPADVPAVGTAATQAPAPVPAPVPATVETAALPQKVAVGKTLLISQPGTRETAAAGATGIGFVTIENVSTADDRLIGASAERAGSVELHTTTMVDGSMQMRPLTEGLVIPAGGTVTLAAGGPHLMLVDLKEPLVAGQLLVVSLRFEQAGTVVMDFPVQALAASE